MKKALVLGGGGFIGGHLAKRLKEEKFWVRIVDIKPRHEFWPHEEICDIHGGRLARSESSILRFCNFQ